MLKADNINFAYLLDFKEVRLSVSKLWIKYNIGTLLYTKCKDFAYLVMTLSLFKIYMIYI